MNNRMQILARDTRRSERSRARGCGYFCKSGCDTSPWRTRNRKVRVCDRVTPSACLRNLFARPFRYTFRATVRRDAPSKRSTLHRDCTISSRSRVVRRRKETRRQQPRPRVRARFSLPPSHPSSFPPTP